MSWSLQFRASAEKELMRLPNAVLARVDAALLRLEKNPYTREVRKLKNHPGYRLRVGDYRVLFEIYPQEKTILICAVRHRGSAYRKK